MNVIKVKNYEEMSAKAAVLIAAEILKKPDCILGFATGGTPVGTYAELARLHKAGTLDFADVTTYNLDEYVGAPPTDKNSYIAFMNENLFKHVNIKPENTHLPNGMAADPEEECQRYEAAIKAAGGIDLQLLGIGHNGHIGFNEPADIFKDATNHVKLTESTINANARYYASPDEVPKSALSMGIGTIMRARSILLLISGKDKAEIAQKALYGPVTPQVPASILQFHQNCTVILALDE